MLQLDTTLITGILNSGTTNENATKLLVQITYDLFRNDC